VGVFVRESSDEINRIAQVSGFDRIQLHGGEPYSQIAELDRPAYRAFRLQSEDEVQALATEPDRTVLLDTFQEGLYGGTGQQFDWGWAREIAESRRVILAGGLTSHNVTAAVAAVRPYGLDVSSSMESTPGRKDPALIEAFFEALDGPTASPKHQGGAHGGKP
jgi:phosphoribosylanthranilate isomerase